MIEESSELSDAPKPSSDIVGERDSHYNEHEELFYVISIRKLGVLFVATFALFNIWWVYRNWSVYKARSGETGIWPVPRALFSMFFAHSLNDAVDRTLRRRQIDFDWEPRSIATWYVVCLIAGNVLARLADKGIAVPWTDILMIAFTLGVLWFMMKTQWAINHACGQPTGASNNSLSWANWIWIVLGSVFWVLVLIGIFLVPSDSFERP